MYIFAIAVSEQTQKTYMVDLSVSAACWIQSEKFRQN